MTGAARAWIDAALDRLTYPDSWLSTSLADFEQWRSHARARLREALGVLPEPVPLDVEKVSEEDRGTYTATRVRFSVDRSFRTEAYLLVPHGSGPFPAVTALHDHGGFYLWGKEKLVRSPVADHPALAAHRRRNYGGRFLADELAQRGYAVVVVDQWLWGEQRIADVPGASEFDLATAEGVASYHALFRDFERRIGYALIWAGSSLPGRMLAADRRALDLLLEDRRVDGARVGCVGLSVGGFRAFHLVAIDDRVRAAVVVGWMCALATYLKGHDHLYRNPTTIGLYAPGMARHLDFPDVASLACPRPLLMIAGRQDALYPIEAVEEAFSKIEAVYASRDAGERVEARWYDAPHCFDVPMQDHAFAWLDRWLKGPNQGA
jgi:dienelactone hydrolase